MQTNTCSSLMLFDPKKILFRFFRSRVCIHVGLSALVFLSSNRFDSFFQEVFTEAGCEREKEYLGGIQAVDVNDVRSEKDVDCRC